MLAGLLKQICWLTCTGLGMQCLQPWIDGLVNPSTVKANLQDIDNTLNGQLKTQLGLLKNNTDSLVVRRLVHLMRDKIP